MVSIRLSRVGKKNHASFRFVVSDKRKDTIGPALEVLGSYDPHVNPAAVNVKADRVQYWLGKGAQPSATVHNLLVSAGVLKAEKVVVAHAPKKVEPPAKPDPALPDKAEPAAPVKQEAPKAEAKAEAAPAAEVKLEEKKETKPA